MTDVTLVRQQRPERSNIVCYQYTLFISIILFYPRLPNITESIKGYYLDVSLYWNESYISYL